MAVGAAAWGQINTDPHRTYMNREMRHKCEERKWERMDWEKAERETASRKRGKKKKKKKKCHRWAETHRDIDGTDTEEEMKMESKRGERGAGWQLYRTDRENPHGHSDERVFPSCLSVLASFALWPSQTLKIYNVVSDLKTGGNNDDHFHHTSDITNHMWLQHMTSVKGVLRNKRIFKRHFVVIKILEILFRASI